MSNKNNLPRILIILGVLIVILGILKVKEKKQGDRSFKSEVISIDTSQVSSIVITPKGENKALAINYENKRWLIDLGNHKVQANDGTIQELLTQLVSLKPKRVASTTKEKWVDFEVNDTLATKIVIKNGKKELASFFVGKFSYDQNTRQMTSYVRNTNEKEVYAIDGYMSMLFNRAPNAYRDNAVLIGEPELWKKIVFTYPADSSFSLVKQNNVWLANGLVADSVKVDKYFSQIRMLTDNNFYDDKLIEASAPAKYSVRIEGDNFKPITISGYDIEGEEVFKSSINKGNQFKSDAIKKVLCVSKERFID